LSWTHHGVFAERNENERKDHEGLRVEGTFHINLFMLP
jgi:hypothetical protein